MHSRIFQIEKKPIPEENYMTSRDVPEWFVSPSTADYVSDDTSREDDVDHLADVLSDIANIVGSRITFTSSTSKYFDKKYEDFIKEVAALSKTSLEEFSTDEGGIGYRMWRINHYYNDKHGFYVYDEGACLLETLDNFLRDVKPGDVYYIGGTVDYHF